MRDFTYKNYITLDEFKALTGYDLTKRVEQGDYETKEEAANNFMQDCFEELKDEVIAQVMGTIWTKNFLQDILNDADVNSIPVLANMKQAFKKALKEHIVYRFEIGDAVACADKETPLYSEHCINLLAQARIICRGL